MDAEEAAVWGVIALILDTGMRPGEVFQMRWEDINWDRGMIFIPRGKTKLSCRFIPMTERVTKALHIRRNGQGWSSNPIQQPVTLQALPRLSKKHGPRQLSKEIVLYRSVEGHAPEVGLRLVEGTVVRI